MTCKRARPIQNPVRLLHLCTYTKTEALKTCQKGRKTKKGQNISKHQPKQGTKFCLDLFSSDFCYFLSLVAGKYLWKPMFFQSPKPTQLEFSFFSVTFSGLDPMGFLLGKKQAVLRCPSYLGLTKSADISIPIKPTMLGDLFFVGDFFNGSLSYGMKIPMSRQPPEIWENMYVWFTFSFASNSRRSMFFQKHEILRSSGWF